MLNSQIEHIKSSTDDVKVAVCMPYSSAKRYKFNIFLLCLSISGFFHAWLLDMAYPKPLWVDYEALKGRKI